MRLENVMFEPRDMPIGVCGRLGTSLVDLITPDCSMVVVFLDGYLYDMGNGELYRNNGDRILDEDMCYRFKCFAEQYLNDNDICVMPPDDVCVYDIGVFTCKNNVCTIATS